VLCAVPDSLLTDAGVAALMRQIGEAVATLHDGGLIHGDLTTSNMLVRHADGALVRSWPRDCHCNKNNPFHIIQQPRRSGFDAICR